METRVAVIAIIVQDSSSAGSINALLHEYDRFIIGRMGLPYRQRGISIINIAIRFIFTRNGRTDKKKARKGKR